MSGAGVVESGENQGFQDGKNPNLSPYSEGDRVLIPQHSLIYEAKVRSPRLITHTHTEVLNAVTKSKLTLPPFSPSPLARTRRVAERLSYIEFRSSLQFSRKLCVCSFSFLPSLFHPSNTFTHSFLNRLRKPCSNRSLVGNTLFTTW